MFTGIIETTGKITSLVRKDSGAQIQIEAPTLIPQLKPGSSVAVNGVCLTVESLKNHAFTVSVVAETLSCSTLAELRVGESVNLEKAAVFGGPIDGHLVTGHIDCTGMLTNIDLKGNSYVYTITVPDEFNQYLVPKGSVAIDGISLTVVKVGPHSFTVSLIPHTLEHTTLKRKTVGQKVNLEFDILSKYAEKHLGLAEMKPGNEGVFEDLMRDLPGQNFFLN